MASNKVKPTNKVAVNLLINSEGQKVLFAEAGKDFIDFLFNILSMPLGTVIRLLKEQGMVGCLANLYESIENLDENYIQPNQNKDIFLKPMAPNSAAANNSSILLLNEASKMGRTFYKCGYCAHTYCISDDTRAICAQCHRQLSTRVPYVAPAAVDKAAAAEEGGFVKGVVTYMVMDDLLVKPMSTISSIAMLNKFNVKEVGALEEKEVDIGMNEGLKLLKASLQSKSVLTSVFLSKTGT